MPILRMNKAAKEINWLSLSIELVILIVGFSVGLQVNEWENRRNDGLLEREYMERLLEDFALSENALQKDVQNLTASTGKLSIGISRLSKPKLAEEDHQKVFEAAGASPIVGAFGVIFGTIEELKDTGNMRLLSSKELRVALANLHQKYRQTIRISEMRNLLRSQSFPVLARQIKPNDRGAVMWDNELAEKNKRELFIALTVLLQNQKLDLENTKELISHVARINAIIASELDAG